MLLLPNLRNISIHPVYPPPFCCSIHTCSHTSVHPVANMFLIPMGMALGADVSVVSFVIRNLIPVTVGHPFCLIPDTVRLLISPFCLILDDTGPGGQISETRTSVFIHTIYLRPYNTDCLCYLFPATQIGNILAGVVCMAVPYCACYGSWSRRLFPAHRQSDSEHVSAVGPSPPTPESGGLSVIGKVKKVLGAGRQREPGKAWP